MRFSIQLSTLEELLAVCIGCLIDCTPVKADFTSVLLTHESDWEARVAAKVTAPAAKPSPDIAGIEV